MRIQRIIALIFASTLLLCLIVGVISWRSKKLLNQINNTRTEVESLLKELESLNERLNRMLAEADMMTGQFQHLPPPTNGVKTSYHDGGYEDSWIQDIDKETGLVLVTTKDSKMSIIFKPASENLPKFHVGWLAPVTFQCTKIKKKKCDFNFPYKLFVSNGLVEVEQLQFPKK